MDPVLFVFVSACVFIFIPVISIIYGTDGNIMDEKLENAAFDTGFALTGNFCYFTA